MHEEQRRLFADNFAFDAQLADILSRSGCSHRSKGQTMTQYIVEILLLATKISKSNVFLQCHVNRRMISLHIHFIYSYTLNIFTPVHMHKYCY